MKVFIYATEGQYEGLHGVFEHDIVDVNDINEAQEIGRDLATQLIEEFELNEEAEWYEQELYWDIYPIKEEYCDMTNYELGSIAFSLGYEDFVEEYCNDLI